MALKIFGVVWLVACTTASHLTYDYNPVYHHQQPLAYFQQPALYHAGTPVTPIITANAPIVRQLDYIQGSPKYDFSYGVHDSLTGDIKSQRESRDGGNVQGSYSLIDSDGYKRTVTYTADDVNGFNAIVQREPLQHIATPIVPIGNPHPEFLPVEQQTPVSVPVQEPSPAIEPSFDDTEIVPPQQEQQEQEEVFPSDNDDFSDSPQADDDSDVVEAYGAAAKSRSGNTIEDQQNPKAVKQQQ